MYDSANYSLGAIRSGPRALVEPPKQSRGGRFSHRLLDAAGLRPAGDERVRSVLWCQRRRSSFVITDRRLLFAQKEGRFATAHWSALGDVRNAGITRAGKNHGIMAAAATSLALGIVLAFVFGPLGFAACLLLAMALSGWWYFSEGQATVYANLGGHSVQGEIQRRNRRRASEFVNLLFELKDSPSTDQRPAA